MRYNRHRKNAVNKSKSTSPFFMPKEKNKSVTVPAYQGMTISSHNDKSEKQADAVADSMINSSKRKQTTNPSLFQTDIGRKEKAKAKYIQKQTEKEEEPAAKIQRQAEKEEEPAAKVQKKSEKEEEVATKSLSGLTEHNVQQQVNKSPKHVRNNKAGAILNEMIKETKGMGRSLPDDIRSEMEQKFQADFSRVRIHIGGEAVKMTNSIHAQAFTHGYDIYFNTGKYQPYSTAGRHLLAHELTHVVQQKGHGN